MTLSPRECVDQSDVGAASRAEPSEGTVSALLALEAVTACSHKPEIVFIRCFHKVRMHVCAQRTADSAAVDRICVLQGIGHVDHYSH